MEKMRDYNIITMQPKFFFGKSNRGFLQKLGLKLILAESCTGGLISHRITNIPGSSDYFLGAMSRIPMKPKKHGWEWDMRHYRNLELSSRETVIEMARGSAILLAKIIFPLKKWSVFRYLELPAQAARHAG